MLELLDIIVILLIVVGWSLITQAARDIFVTVRLAATVPQKNEQKTIYFYSLSCLLISRAFHIIKSRKRLRIFAPAAGVLFPALQFLFWKMSIVFGFAFLYLAVNLKLKGEGFADQFSEDFFSAIWLSFTISARFAPYNLNSDEMLVFLIANLQFYLGFLFYGFVCFYLLTLWRKAKRLQPRLYGLENELKKTYSPFDFSDKLKESYNTKEIITILGSWELWADRLRDDLISCPSLIYNRSLTKNRTWLASLNIVLDASAAVIVTSDAAVECQGKRAFAAARHTLVVIADYIQVLPPDSRHLLSFQKSSANYADEILSAEIIYDAKENCTARKEIEMLSIWQFTYQSTLWTLSDYLAVELPSRNEKKLPVIE
ncbi:MAG TPA: hypothetical protein VNI60_00095 [Pyrinomonadaceae bacterium]|jgi:hypothetical protein|nr:hypothetical protein [Pyrinomonadaceae bacterium]